MVTDFILNGSFCFKAVNSLNKSLRSLKQAKQIPLCKFKKKEKNEFPQIVLLLPTKLFGNICMYNIYSIQIDHSRITILMQGSILF